MAKDKRFPSDANKPKIMAPPAPAPAPVVAPIMAKRAPTLVQVQYNKLNHHWMESVHMLAPGLNQVSQEVWDRSKDHPAMKQLIKDGHVKVVAAGEPKEE